MKLSKSIILSPGRAAGDGAASGKVTQSSSLTRRLRANGSFKGGGGGKMSPFFSKKRGSSFENPEPSSPKVTCIGQVRVKTKKKVKKQNTSLSRRRNNGDVSFRRIEQGEDRGPSSIRYSAIGVPNCLPPPECASHRSQRWVHLPVSVCEALLAFRAEFTCFKGSCFSTKSEIHNASSENDMGCGSVFSRWLVSLNDGEGGTQREIELVVGGGDEPGLERGYVRRSARRHVFEDLEVKDGRIQVRGQYLVGEDETTTVSISIPPKNALLLMRCRSNPMKMAALMNRLSWEAEASPSPTNATEEGEEEPSKQVQGQMQNEKKEPILDMEVEEEPQVESSISSFDALLMQNNPEICQDVEEEDTLSETPHSNSSPADAEIEETDAKLEINEETEEKEQQPETQITDSTEEPKKDEGGPSLPECLLLMMCEPKLSMEVSKETWVCSTDFIRWLPGRPHRPAKTSKDDGCCHEHVKRRFSMIDSKPKPLNNSNPTTALAPVPEKHDLIPPPPKPPQQPARSSCSALSTSMANMIEQKLMSEVGHEPLVLKRCKSEPMSTAAAKLLPESCAMTKMEVEPHRRAAAGIGF